LVRRVFAGRPSLPGQARDILTTVIIKARITAERLEPTQVNLEGDLQAGLVGMAAG
jgi:hypothetical protein